MSAKSTTYRPSRRVQFTIWALLVTTVAAVFPLSGYAHAMADLNSSDASTSTSQAAGESVVLAGGLDPVNEGVVNNSPAVKTVEEYGDDPIELLPAYRWKSAVHLPQQYSAKDMVESGGSKQGTYQVAEMMFSIAGLVWGLLLSILRFAMSLDIVEAASGAINSGFNRVSNALGTAGMVAMVAAAAVGGAALSIFKKGGLNAGAIQKVLSCVLMLGLLQLFGTATDPASGEDSTSIRTPAGMALLGNRYINEAGGAVATAFGGTESLTSSARAGRAGGMDTGLTTCNFYIQRLYANYGALSKDAGQPSITAQSLTMASYLWQRAVYDNWTVAAFGGTNNAKRIACHQMEVNAGIDPALQQAVVSDGSATATEGKTARANLGGYDGMGLRAFADLPDRKQQETAMIAWAACDGKTMRPGWDKTHDASNTGDSRYGGKTPCEMWFTTAMSDDAAAGAEGAQSGIAIGNKNIFRWSDQGQLREDTVSSDKCDAADAGCTKADLRNINSVVMAYWGHNSGQKVMGGLMALVNSGVYAWAFGAAAAGTILTQFGLLFLLMVLPWTLLMLAMPSKNGGGAQGTGRKLLKTTVTFMAAKVMFIALLGVTMTVMTTLFDVVLGENGMATKSALAGEGVQAVAGDTGTTQQAWSLVIPIVTIVIMNQLTKALGLKGIMSLSGAAGFATAAATKSMGGKGISGFNKALEGGLGKYGSKRFAENALKKGTRGLKSGINGAAQAPGKLRTKAAELNSALKGRKELRKPENADLLSASSLKKVGHARLTKKDARTEALLRREGLTAGQATDVRSGKLSKEAALADNAKRVGDANPFGVDAEVANISDIARGARAASYRLATAGKDAQEAGELRTTMLAGELASAQERLRTDGRSGVVSATAVDTAISDLRARSGNQNVIGGVATAPMIVPSGTRIAGSANLAYTEFQAVDGESVEAVAARREAFKAMVNSPAAVLSAKVLEKRASENSDEYALRIAASCIAAGSLDDKGRYHDFAAELGLPEDGEELDRVIAEFAKGEGTFANRFTASRRELSAADIIAVDALVASRATEMKAVRSGAHAAAARATHQTEVATRLAQQLAEMSEKFEQQSAQKMAKTIEGIAQTMDKLSVANGGQGGASQAVAFEIVNALGLPPADQKRHFEALRQRLDEQAKSLVQGTMRDLERTNRATQPQVGPSRRSGPGSAASPMG